MKCSITRGYIYSTQVVTRVLPTSAARERALRLRRRRSPSARPSTTHARKRLTRTRSSDPRAKEKTNDDGTIGPSPYREINLDAWWDLVLPWVQQRSSHYDDTNWLHERHQRRWLWSSNVFLLQKGKSSQTLARSDDEDGVMIVSAGPADDDKKKISIQAALVEQ